MADAGKVACGTPELLGGWSVGRVRTTKRFERSKCSDGQRGGFFFCNLNVGMYVRVH